MSSFAELHADFKDELSLMKAGIGFVQSAYKGIGPLREAKAKAATPWPAELAALVDSLILPDRKAENLTYDGSVVLLSAAYESFARDIIEELCREIERKIPKFDNLPDKIKSENARATGRVLSKHNEKRFSQFDYLKLSEHLGSCIVGSDKYRLNSGPLASHDRNLNSRELADLFHRVGIDKLWERIGAVPCIQQFFSVTESDPAKKSAIAKLDEFIPLRNQVAHTGSGEDSIGPEALTQWVDFFLVLAESLSVVATEYCTTLLPPVPAIPAVVAIAPAAPPAPVDAPAPQPPVS